MKKHILLLAAMLVVMADANATQWSVSNATQNPGQFNSILTAIASVSVLNGDTLLVHPTVIPYSDAITISKRLTIIGGGFNTSKIPQLITNISGIITLSSASSGSRFYGIKHGLVTSTGAASTISNIVFEDCYGVSDITLSTSNIINSNFVFRNCIETQIIFSGANLSNTAFFTNCIFTQAGINTSKGNTFVTNCLFIGSSHLSATENAVFQNCIFQNSTFPASVFNNSFSNCFYVGVTTGGTSLSTTSIPPLPIGNGTAAFPGNTGTKDSSMSASPFFDGHTASTLSLTGSVNYHLTGNGLTYAIDGGTIGVYGGNSNFSLKGEPLNSAIIRSFNITNTVVPVNGDLNINLMVTKPVTQ